MPLCPWVFCGGQCREPGLVGILWGRGAGGLWSVSRSSGVRPRVPGPVSIAGRAGAPVRTGSGGPEGGRGGALGWMPIPGSRGGLPATLAGSGEAATRVVANCDRRPPVSAAVRAPWPSTSPTAATRRPTRRPSPPPWHATCPSAPTAAPAGPMPTPTSAPTWPHDPPRRLLDWPPPGPHANKPPRPPRLHPHRLTE
jgi:hypothetical protein